MTSTVIGISAAFAACLILAGVVVWLAVRRSSRRADARVEEVVRTLEVRMDELVHELAGAVARAEEEGRRSRFLGEIAGSIDLDEVLGRTLDAASGLPGASAALIRLENHEKPIVATLGLSVEEADRQAIAGPPDGRPARSIEILYRYPEGTAGEGEELIHGGLAVPLNEGGRRIGYLTVFTRTEERRFDEGEVQQLEELAERAGPAIENARRFREARQLADLDALTGLHNRRYFHETLARETARAHRYNRKVALVVFDLDDFKDVNDRIGHLAGDAVLAEAAERVRDVVRSADIPCRIGGDEFAVIMPESGLPDAERLHLRVRAAVSERPIGQAGRIFLSAGLAELRPGDDSVGLFERADEALYRAKEAGKGRAVGGV
ncbi:MAG TPA: sensor domain-containing diguanylate cyclase [Gaiellaceae bacterium]|nr:sensor domain-containing diguanylate cyclase [Gaiellaceae bacterium]